MPFWLAVLGVELPPLRLAPDLLRLAVLRLAPLPLERAEPLLEREALLRLREEAAGLERDEAAGFEREEPAGFERDEAAGLERDEPLPERADPLVFVFGFAPFAERLLLCPLRDVDLLLAIPNPLHRKLLLPRFVPT